jgi:mevalonate kinase
MVTRFLENCKQKDYLYAIMNQFLPLNNDCIHYLIKGEMNNFFKQLKNLSRFQYSWFSDMIPDDYKALWKHGFDSDEYTLKLCGSGGGGYILGFASNLDQALQFLSKQNADIITVYKSSRI